MCPFHKA
jgi:WD40 repeat protein